jgi:hypothetical protein
MAAPGTWPRTAFLWPTVASGGMLVKQDPTRTSAGLADGGGL